MRNWAVLHVNSGAPTSTSPTMRIAAFVANELKIPLICDPISADQHKNKKFDVLFIKYGMLKFSAHRDQALEIYANAKHIINLENDYLFALDKRFRPADETWSTVAGKTRYVNWNMITRHGIDAWKRRYNKFPTPMHPGIIYYGAHRPNRVEYFQRYFKEAPYKVTISTFRGRKAFWESCGLHTIGAFKDPDKQAQWPLTIYIQDKFSNQQYTSPATRFYECVMAGIAQVVDCEAVQTLKLAKIPVHDMDIVEDQAGVKNALRNWQNLQHEQQIKWFKDYSSELRFQFDLAVKQIGA